MNPGGLIGSDLVLFQAGRTYTLRSGDVFGLLCKSYQFKVCGFTKDAYGKPAPHQTIPKPSHQPPMWFPQPQPQPQLQPQPQPQSQLHLQQASQQLKGLKRKYEASEDNSKEKEKGQLEGTDHQTLKSIDNRPVCRYDGKCYRKNSDHWDQYKHLLQGKPDSLKRPKLSDGESCHVNPIPNSNPNPNPHLNPNSSSNPKLNLNLNPVLCVDTTASTVNCVVL
eukprot:TRINITY_DN8197_c0_g2_i2.p1 TRINITY_DN8197_c0_g2~~TRINITY_DN8197_c0_g2_i2.p1  ORF type:complete len:222 (-),score=50.54 TRINITY_DN8197_c0_g2_i2:94-759(-)